MKINLKSSSQMKFNTLNNATNWLITKNN